MNDEKLLSLVNVMNDVYSFVDDLEELSDRYHFSAWVTYSIDSETGRILEQVWKDQNAKIHEFVTAFRNLQADLTSTTLLYTTFVASRTLTDVDELGE